MVDDSNSAAQESRQTETAKLAAMVELQGEIIDSLEEELWLRSEDLAEYQAAASLMRRDIEDCKRQTAVLPEQQAELETFAERLERELAACQGTIDLYFERIEDCQKRRAAAEQRIDELKETRSRRA